MDDGLSRTQMVRLVALGLLVWFIGAMAVRFGRPLGLFDAYLPLLYLATVPVMFATVWIVRLLAGLRPGAPYVTGVALATAAAIACDGLIISFHPALYGGEGDGLARGAAWILWAGAVGFLPPLWSLRSAR